MKTCLFDVKMLLAFSWPDHAHHDLVHEWWKRKHPKKWATCMLTELGFVRISSHPKFSTTPTSPEIALLALNKMTRRKGHVFWNESSRGLGDPEVTRRLMEATNHADISDAFAAMAKSNNGLLVTLDRKLAEKHPTLPNSFRCEHFPEGMLPSAFREESNDKDNCDIDTKKASLPGLRLDNGPHGDHNAQCCWSLGFNCPKPAR